MDWVLNLCTGLLVTAIGMLIIATVLVILGFCLGLPLLWMIGLGMVIIGLIMLGAWGIFCSIFTPCSLMQTVHCTMFWMIAVFFPIIVFLVGWFGGFPCWLSAAASWGGWGMLYAWFGFLMRRFGCSSTC